MLITESLWNEILYNSLEEVRSEAPYKVGRPLKHLPSKSTGNLKYDALKMERVNATTWRIYIDEKIAPYMPYTNEKWIDKKWKGAKNPNYKWFDHVAKHILSEVRRRAIQRLGKDSKNVSIRRNVAMGMPEEEEEW